MNRQERRESSREAAIQARADLRVHSAAILVYFAYRLLGAEKPYAWERARIIVALAIIDKVESLTGRRPNE